MNRMKPQRLAVLNFIAQRLDQKKPAPTLMEIADHCKFESSTAANYHVTALIDLGFVVREPRSRFPGRGLALTDAGRALHQQGQQGQQGQQAEGQQTQELCT